MPSEAKLCERFGVSRTTVHRVLAQMEGTGLLAAVTARGAQYASFGLPPPGRESCQGKRWALLA
ncbi:MULTISPECIES: GntR family transcriptional regulator [unclassified Streptomyces]|uniref:GntR family transcriptional regulator n=1 Tax=unclassified Streptomyces TaxID=2593676 RepID=UPI0027404625|nr:MULTISPECIES: GntR family transcriptional regulator [unclassified Streptomyces]